MPMHNLIKYSDAQSKTSRMLWQQYRDESALNDNGKIIDFPADNNTASFKIKQQVTGQTRNGGTKNVEIMVSLKYLIHFSRTLEMPLINFDISLQLKWSRKCIIVAATTNNQNPTFQVNDAKLSVPIVTLSTPENIKLFKQLDLILIEQLIGINIQPRQQIGTKLMFRLSNWSKFSGSKQTFCLVI